VKKTECEIGKEERIKERKKERKKKTHVKV
jgi:hypothetical protein